MMRSVTVLQPTTIPSVEDADRPGMFVLRPHEHLHKLHREKRNRHSKAFIITDSKSGTLIATQKLRHAVYFINKYLARSRREVVTVPGLFEAIGTESNRNEGFHKLRYRISATNIGTAHTAFETARNKDIRMAIVLAESHHSVLTK